MTVAWEQSLAPPKVRLKARAGLSGDERRDSSAPSAWRRSLAREFPSTLFPLMVLKLPPDGCHLAVVEQCSFQSWNSLMGPSILTVRQGACAFPMSWSVLSRSMREFR